MREIEIKVKVHDVAVLKSKLLEQGIVLSSAIKQHDRVWGEPGGVDAALNTNWLRIRTENDAKHIFTLKKSVVGHLDSIEHETVISDAEELENIINELGYETYSDLTKIRQKAQIGDIEICIDEVPGLGTFIEAEKIMAIDANHDEVVEEIWNLLLHLNMSKNDEVYEGYDVLERRQRGI